MARPAPTMEYSPPPLFKQGPSAFARLFFFIALALALLVSDARFNMLETLRAGLGTALYPLQRLALLPRDLYFNAANLTVTKATLWQENQQLRNRNLQLSQRANRAEQLAAENVHLRAVLELRQRIAVQTTPVEIQYDTSDPFSQKVVIGHEARQDIRIGAPVVNENGVVGQVTRVFPLQAEITLLTDRDFAIPVQVLRTGLRSVIYGTPKGDLLDLRFVPTSADIITGDVLVTSGLDGVYPPGLPVAKVSRVDKLADTAFARVNCLPLATVRGAREMLVLRYQRNIPLRPAAAPAPNAKRKPAPSKAATGNATAPAGPTAKNQPAPPGPAAASQQTPGVTQ